MADKWGIPHFYASASDAGVSGSGSGFNWNQNNNFRVDQDKGMLRLGKESDDCELINSTTGEWEFPFASGADYFCMEGRQGHKSGGESHGCEGGCYIANVTINTTPAKFYFQKQMYHGGPKYEHSSGKFGHARVTEKVVGKGFKGFAFVIYNKENGRSTGHDSAILEIWWNEDPVNNLKNGWFMVKRIEDKGGWGKEGNTCGGVSDQVITWSNIQHRYKSGTPDFSLHPRKPEFEDGPVIHSIGEEDMDFEASEKRGYGYREDMLQNFEQKCLFKFDSNNGICRLKNLSLREIDAEKALDDDPDQPTGNEQPGETQTIQGKFKLQWDINTQRQSECAGAGAGGAGGSSIFFTETNIDDTRAITNHVDHAYRSRVGQKVNDTVSPMNGKKLKQFDVQLQKVGTPGSSPTVDAIIVNPSGSIISTSSNTLDPSTLSDASWTTVSFNFSANTHTFVVGDRVAVRYGGTSNANYVIVPILDSSETHDVRSSYNLNTNTWSDIDASDLTCIMWE